MSIRLVVLIMTVFLAYNTYYDGKYIQLLKSWKKYYIMAGYLISGLFFFIYLNKHPNDGLSLLRCANKAVRYMPIDTQSRDLISPILTHMSSQDNNTSSFTSTYTPVSTSSKPSHSSTTSTTKRSVGETKKKYVAANQNWRCAHCTRQLPAWFEVDHKTRLQYGGSNNIDNLEALCRDCHGKKTAEEHLNII